MEANFLIIAFYDKNKLADLLGNNYTNKEMYNKILTGRKLYFNKMKQIEKYNSLETRLALIPDDVKTLKLDVQKPFKIILHTTIPSIHILKNLKKNSTLYKGEIREKEDNNSIWDFIINWIILNDKNINYLNSCWDKIPTKNNKLINKIIKSTYL